MKKLLLFIFVILIIYPLYRCTTTTTYGYSNFNTEKLEVICKVWGLLKYYHPAVGSGLINWDNKLIKTLEAIDTVYNRGQLNRIINDLIIECDNYEINLIDTLFLDGKLKFHRNIDWLNNNSYLSPENIHSLKKIINNKKPYINHYVSQINEVGNLEYSNELEYQSSMFPSKNLRLLALFRFWNIVYYFYPYLELNDLSWNSVLGKYIPRLINSKDSLDYHYTVLEFTSELNDGHIWTESIPLALHLGILSPPYKVECIEDKAIITMLFPDSIGKLYNVCIGDQILSIDNISVGKIVENRSKYYSYSNPFQHKRRIYEELLITPNKDSIILDIKRDNVIFREVIPTYYLFDLYGLLDNQEDQMPAYEIINDSIGYINLRYLDNNEIDEMMPNLMETVKLIIDIRNYPKNVLYNLSKYLNSDSVEFVKVFVPNLVHPGSFIWWQSPLFTGTQNENYYKGDVVLIVNEQTQSHAEFTTMCLQTAPSVVTIGSVTAGTDGNVSYISLPGGITTMITSIGLEYPDGTPTQRVGVKIDKVVRPLIQDYRNKYDRLLEYAIHL